MSRKRAWLDHADCRLDTGHHWRTVKDLGVIGADWTKLQRCTGCQTTRRRGWNVWTGALTPHTYRYVEGYLQEPGKRLSLAQQRVAYSRTVLREAVRSTQAVG
jgi:hypothetical protein